MTNNINPEDNHSSEPQSPESGNPLDQKKPSSADSAKPDSGIGSYLRGAFKRVFSGEHAKKARSGMNRRDFLRALGDHAAVAGTTVAVGTPIVTQPGCSIQGGVEKVAEVVGDAVEETVNDIGEEVDKLLRWLDILASKIPVFGDEEAIPFGVVMDADPNASIKTTQGILGRAYEKVKDDINADLNARLKGNESRRVTRIVQAYYTLYHATEEVKERYMEARHKREAQVELDEVILDDSGNKIDKLNEKMDRAERMMEPSGHSAAVDALFARANSKKRGSLAHKKRTHVQAYTDALNGANVDPLFKQEVIYAKTLSGLRHGLKLADHELRNLLEERRESGLVY